VKTGLAWSYLYPEPNGPESKPEVHFERLVVPKEQSSSDGDDPVFLCGPISKCIYPIVGLNEIKSM
jgi:hypothetical protein